MRILIGEFKQETNTFANVATTVASFRDFHLYYGIDVVSNLRAGANFVLAWPSSFAGFSLHSLTNLSSTNWTPVTNAPALVSGNYHVTNGDSID